MIIGVEILSILDVIFKAVKPFFKDFQELGLFILGLFIFIEIMKSAISLIMGNGFKFTDSMLTLLVISVILTAYEPLIQSMWNMAFKNLRIMLSNLGGIGLEHLGEGSMTSLEALWASVSVSLSGGEKSLIYGVLSSVPLFLIMTVFLVIVNITFYLVIAGHFFGFIILLLSGYVFIPCLFSSDLRQTGIVWINSLIVYIATFVGFGIAFQICAALEYIGNNTYTNKFILHGDPSYILQILMIPLLQVTVLLKVPGTIASLIGHGSGAGGGHYGYSGLSMFSAVGIGVSRSLGTLAGRLK